MPDEILPGELIPYEELEPREREVLEYFVQLSNEHGLPSSTFYPISHIVTLDTVVHDYFVPGEFPRDQKWYANLFKNLCELHMIGYLEREPDGDSFALRPETLPPIQTVELPGPPKIDWQSN